jgi:transposase-like protein
MPVQRRRDSQAALRLMHKLLKKQGFAPKLLVTDKLRSYGSAFRRLRCTCPHDRGLALETPIRQCGDESARCSGSISSIRAAFSQHPLRCPQHFQLKGPLAGASPIGGRWTRSS